MSPAIASLLVIALGCVIDLALSVRASRRIFNRIGEK
jgi:hypothetical protein